MEISTKASEDFAGLNPKALQTIHQALDALETTPRPPRSRRRTAPGHFTVGAGLHRILYAVNEEARLITIERIRPRSR